MMTVTPSRHTWLRRVGESANVCWERAGHHRPRRAVGEAGDDLGKPQPGLFPLTPASLKIYFHPEGNQSVVILTYSLMCSLAIVTDILLLVMLPAVTNGIFAAKEVVFKEKHPSFSVVTELTVLAKTTAQQSLLWPMNLTFFGCKCAHVYLYTFCKTPTYTGSNDFFLLLFMQRIISVGVHYSQASTFKVQPPFIQKSIGQTKFFEN